ncbi:glycosyltransferase [Teichococcus oryzae]|uniref:Glycosyltransferase n=1 Tax=Teichococcus oryzae TaxID=1608942 RepID=A0A5B2TAR2_9PROT|nr:glycosyltransferase [Pseudoroseomonas oryzae]KAA2211626.1 glycosyltransferase [Pseudoroseomonas oryzae]
MMVSLPSLSSSAPAATSPAVVAIPARNEAARITACLDALAAQPDASSLTVLLLLNGCADETEALARACAARATFRLVLRHEKLPSGLAHAGEARWRALDAAADLLEREAQPEGLLLTTDADSQVAPDWLATTRAELDKGADAVAGRVEYDPDEVAALPSHLRHRMGLEAAYAALLAEMEARLDPVQHDAWPRHRMASGASLAIRLPAYRRAGGLPRVRVGEDRAMIAALRAIDARVRHAPGVRVLTSCRTDGRAIGGAADTLRRWLREPASLCDPALEPAPRAAMRWRARAELRRLHAAAEAGGAALWATRFLLPPAFFRDLPNSCFGALWQMAEAASPLLHPVPLHPAGLAAEIDKARQILAGLSAAAADPGGICPYGPEPA